MPREAEVLEGFAKEEAAKILVLMDAVRCPAKLLPSKLGTIIGWFYDHLARLIYAEAVTWKPMHLAQLREYVEPRRKAHYLEGSVGEYIVPNWVVYQRESGLYADIEAYEDGEPRWSMPSDHVSAFAWSFPTALRVVEAISALGIFTTKGLKATSEIWGQVEFSRTEDHTDAERLTEMLLERLIREKLPTEAATQEHVNALYDDWQLPMYDFDFSPIHVSLQELEAERERRLWEEFGEPYY